MSFLNYDGAVKCLRDALDARNLFVWYWVSSFNLHHLMGTCSKVSKSSYLHCQFHIALKASDVKIKQHFFWYGTEIKLLILGFIAGGRFSDNGPFGFRNFVCFQSTLLWFLIPPLHLATWLVLTLLRALFIFSSFHSKLRKLPIIHSKNYWGSERFKLLIINCFLFFFQIINWSGDFAPDLIRICHLMFQASSQMLKTLPLNFS